jgi:hypothetical protein
MFSPNCARAALLCSQPNVAGAVPESGLSQYVGEVFVFQRFRLCPEYVGAGHPWRWKTGFEGLRRNITKNLCQYFHLGKVSSAMQQIVADNLFNTTGNVVEFPALTFPRR